MKCPSCGLENPPSAMKCDCGYPLGIAAQPTQTIHTSSAPRSSAIRIIWLIPLLAALFAAADFAFNWDAQKSAPQQAALAGFALVCTVIPYCLARAVVGLSGKSD